MTPPTSITSSFRKSIREAISELSSSKQASYYWSFFQDFSIFTSCELSSLHVPPPQSPILPMPAGSFPCYLYVAVRSEPSPHLLQGACTSRLAFPVLLKYACIRDPESTGVFSLSESHFRGAATNCLLGCRG